jgi:hypothetical protein
MTKREEMQMTTIATADAPRFRRRLLFESEFRELFGGHFKKKKKKPDMRDR